MNTWTGTIGLAMDCDTTSIEPFFSHIIYKKLSGGGYMKLVNKSISSALKKLGYSHYEIQEIEEYMLNNEKLEGSPYLKEEHLPIFDTANKSKGGYRYIRAEGHLYMIAQATPLVSGAISKTVNLPKEATVEKFKEINELAWKLGVKAISLYRDGCKVSQPLNVSLDEKKKEDMTYKELLEYIEILEHKLANNDTHEHKHACIEEEVPEGYHKVKCSNCGSEQVIPNGTCSICMECGSTSGCS